MTSKNVEIPPKTVLTLTLISIFNILVSCSLLAIEAWISNNCGTRFSSAHGVLSPSVMDSQRMFPNAEYKSVVQTIGWSLSIDRLLTRSDSHLTLTPDSGHNPPFSHQYPISASTILLRAWTWDPCISVTRLAWNETQNSCIFTQLGFCLVSCYWGNPLNGACI